MASEARKLKNLPGLCGRVSLRSISSVDRMSVHLSSQKQTSQEPSESPAISQVSAANPPAGEERVFRVAHRVWGLGEGPQAKYSTASLFRLCNFAHICFAGL